MANHSKILILTASYGDGHLQVSDAVKQALHHRGYTSVQVIDLYRKAHPVLNTLARFVYLRSPAFSAYGIDYYGWSYYSTRDLTASSSLAKGLNLLGSKRLLDVILEEQPSAIVMTFPFGSLTRQLRDHHLHIPIFTVITDFSLHNRWLYSEPDQYYVATEDLKQSMVLRGISEKSIAVSGIPIREAFYEAIEEPVSPRSILIVAGAYGVLRDIHSMIDRLLHVEQNVQINVICGMNDKLKRELNKRFGAESRLQVLGYVRNLHLLMRSASCMVTKAGGITLSEAIHLQTPILIYRPFPGQEKENARYLENKGAAFVTNRIPDLVDHAKKLIADTPVRQQTIASMRSLARDRAADTIASGIIQSLRVPERIIVGTGT